jgi:chloramphenicol O-acetyltransferase
MCVNLDLAAFYPAVKQRGVSLTVGIVYIISRLANEIPELRCRVRSGEVVEHEVVHPIHLSPADSIPRFAWGKIFEEGGARKIPLSAQAHHALLDGLHMGRFFEKVQDLLNAPGYLSEK